MSRPQRDHLRADSSAANIFSPTLEEKRIPVLQPFAKGGDPPSPVFTKTNKHAGENEQVCKIVCKNLISKNLQIKI
jgi:hypothetical protein